MFLLQVNISTMLWAGLYYTYVDTFLEHKKKYGNNYIQSLKILSSLLDLHRK